MIQQQRFGGSTLGTPARIVAEHGASSLGRGITTTMGREAMFTMSMLGITPLIQEKLVKSSGMEKNVALAAGSLTGALLAGVVTHPMDTIKTCLQGDIERKKFTTNVGTFKTLMSEAGASAFFRGWSFRTGRMILAIGIMNECKLQLSPLFFPHHFE